MTDTGHTVFSYRKKPVVIEAVRYIPNQKIDAALLPTWFVNALVNREIKQVESGSVHPYLEIETLEGTMRANAGDYVIRGVKGELYPCKPEIFEATYDALSDEERAT